MKIRSLSFVAASICTLTVGIVAASTLNNLSGLHAELNGEYAIYFDDTHNYNLELHNSNLFKRFTAKTQRGTDIEFLEQNLAVDDASDWRAAEYTAGLLNTTKIGGLSDITINFTDYNENDEGVVTIKYGWVVGSESNGHYDDSPLDQYEDTLSSGEAFDFSGVQPSYFFIQFKRVSIQSIAIHFSCSEHIPDPAEESHYELVKSMSSINNEDIYAISSTKMDAGYMISNATYKPNYEDDKIRQVTAVAPNNEKIADKDDILQFRITKESDLYYFQAQNYLGTNPTGYLTTLDDDKNNSFISPAESKIGFEVSLNEEYQITIALNATKYKKLSFYSDPGSTAFNFYYKTKSPIYLYKYVEVNEQELTLTYSQLSSMSKSYSNGNYGKITNGGISYEYYRTVRASTNSSGYAFSMINPNYSYGDGGYPSSFYNLPTSPIYGIRRISVTYKATSGIRIGYSKVIGDESYQTMPASSSYVTNYVDVDRMHFFKIMTNGSDAYIKDITLLYNNKVTAITSNTSYSGNRKSVGTYSGTLIDGVTTFSMYISASETKTYTYYSKQYAYDNYSSIDKSKAFMLDPVDVCNYYLAFHEFPANYVTSGEKSTYGSKFGSYARQVSTYSRTDGYATAVPYNNKPGQSNPIYYELDIDLNGTYSLSSRQVGRVVVWEYGFSCYNDGPVCVYTDDHYATFQEYNCMGGFAHRFNSERSVAGKTYTPLTII